MHSQTLPNIATGTYSPTRSSQPHRPAEDTQVRPSVAKRVSGAPSLSLALHRRNDSLISPGKHEPPSQRLPRSPPVCRPRAWDSRASPAHVSPAHNPERTRAGLPGARGGRPLSRARDSRVPPAPQPPCKCPLRSALRQGGLSSVVSCADVKERICIQIACFIHVETPTLSRFISFGRGF